MERKFRFRGVGFGFSCNLGRLPATVCLITSFRLAFVCRSAVFEMSISAKSFLVSLGVLLMSLSAFALPSAREMCALMDFDRADVEKITPEVFSEFSARAEKRDSDALVGAGVCRYLGIGTQRDVSRAAKDFTAAAFAGNPYGMFAAAVCMSDGDGLVQYQRGAIALWESSAKKGCLNSLNRLGICYYKGVGVPADPVRAVEFFKKAIELNRAKVSLARAYLEGRGVGKNPAEALRLLELAARGGNVVAQNNLGIFWFEGLGGKSDEFKAFSWFESAAKKDYPPSILFLGMSYLQGTGVPPDAIRGVSLLKKAANLGNTEAQNNLAYCYANGIGVEQNSALAFEYYKKAAVGGYALAQNTLGDCYFSGNGCAEDKAEAVKWYRRAAFQGDVSAQSNLGYCYLEGIGIGKSAADAIKWLKKAADAGDVPAQSNLGTCYVNAIGVEQNLPEAVKYLKLAADKEDAQAMGNLGACYYNGLGVERDQFKGLDLLRRAAKAGNEDAKKALYRLR